MGYRQVYIKKASYLKFKDNQLILIKDDVTTKVPLEDINYILLEDNATIVTSRLLSELGKNAIALIICDEKHIPSSIMYPFNHHYKQLENLEFQLKNTDIMKNELWKNIVKSKINNQKRLLEIKTEDEDTINKLGEYIDTVELADCSNREGLAAKIYFKSLFGSNFIRHYDNAINNALDYGYSIIVSCVIRTLSIYGLLTYYGINHISKTNNYNLAYDLVEPFRPLVDAYVYNNMENLNSDLSFKNRKELVNILNKDVIVSGRHYSVEYAIDLLIKSYVKSISTGETVLDLPELIYD